MSDLNDRLRDWRQSLGELTDAQRDELEDHLRESIAELQGRGLSGREAWAIAQMRCGHASEWLEAYAQVHPGQVWGHRLGWMVAGVMASQLIATAALFWGFGAMAAGAFWLPESLQAWAGACFFGGVFVFLMLLGWFGMRWLRPGARGESSAISRAVHRGSPWLLAGLWLFATAVYGLVVTRVGWMPYPGIDVVQLQAWLAEGASSEAAAAAVIHALTGQKSPALVLLEGIAQSMAHGPLVGVGGLLGLWWLVRWRSRKARFRPVS